MLHLRSIVLAANACYFAQSFAPPSLAPAAFRSSSTQLEAGTDVEALLAKVRALREAAASAEGELQSDLLQKKKTKDDATDLIIEQLFPSAGDDGTALLCDRLREKRLASSMLVQIVERIHEREVAARGLEHVEHSVKQNKVTFERVAKEDEAELAKVQGLVSRLIGAAEVLDKEFFEAKSQGNEKITNADLMHWGGGDMAGIIKQKAKELGREQSEQFQKRQQSFFDAATRTHSRDEFHEYSWQDSWKGVEEKKGKKKK